MQETHEAPVSSQFQVFPKRKSWVFKPRRKLPPAKQPSSPPSFVELIEFAGGIVVAKDLGFIAPAQRKALQAHRIMPLAELERQNRLPQKIG